MLLTHYLSPIVYLDLILRGGLAKSKDNSHLKNYDMVGGVAQR